MATHGSPADSREVLHRVAVHVVARSRVEAAGRFSLRVTPGGFGTPELANGRRVRVSRGQLLVESDAAGSPSVHGRSIDGSTLAELAAFAGVDLARPLDVGHDTPPLGDVDAVLHLDGGAADEVAGWYGDVAAILDAVAAEAATSGDVTLARLWPEHFDVAIEVQATAAERLNLGGSPGDGYLDEPYLYVGPWSASRPGDAAFWNASFGASIGRSALVAAGPDVVSAGVAFLLEGYRRFR